MDYKWIGVDNKLPEFNKKVLCIRSVLRKNKTKYFIEIASLKKIDSDGLGFEVIRNRTVVRSFTHWMPLPEPPGDDNGK